MSQERTQAYAKAMSAGADRAPREIEPRPDPGNKVFSAEKLLLARMMESLGNPPLDLVLWDGQEIASPGKHSVARVLIRDRGALLKLIANPELGFGEMYTAERIEVRGNLVDCLEAIYRALPRTEPSPIGKCCWRRSIRRRATQSPGRGAIFTIITISATISTSSGSIGRWCTPALTFPTRRWAWSRRKRPSSTMCAASCGSSLAKPCSRPGVAGARWRCTWPNTTATVKAYNISRTDRLRAGARPRKAWTAGCSSSRTITATLAANSTLFVSVGMLEHVGTDQYRTLGTVIDRCLKDTGRGLIHSIGRDRPSPMTPWIERNIFPGACPPSLSQMTQIFEPFGFSVLDVENLRLHYAKTLEHWLERYEANIERVAQMFDPEFVRAWRLYLAGSLAAFRSGDMQLFQVSFNRSGQNRIPWTRQYLYSC